jgi:hypothetical protein
VGTLKFTNDASNGTTTGGVQVAQLTTDADTNVTIKIFDQFGQLLDSVYDGDQVVTEQFSNTVETGLPGGGGPALSTTEIPITIPDKTLTNGVKLDEVGFTENTLWPNLLTAVEIIQWQNGTLCLDDPANTGLCFNNVFSLRNQHPHVSGTQTIRVHGYKVTPDFLRTQEVKPQNSPPLATTIPFTATDVAQ